MTTEQPPLIGLDGFRVPCQFAGCDRRAARGSRCELHVESPCFCGAKYAIHVGNPGGHRWDCPARTGQPVIDRRRPPDPEGTQYVVDFEPGLYGPFGSRDAASDWARAFTKGNGSWCVCPLGLPNRPPS